MKREYLLFLAPLGMSVAMGGVLSICGSLIAIQRVGMNSFELGLLGCVGGPFYMLVSYVTGHISDRSHPKRLVVAGAVSSLAMCALYVFVSEKWHIYALGVFSGVCNGLFWAPFQSWLRHEREGDISRSASYYNISWGGGETIGILIGGRLYQIAPWMGVMGAVGGCALACAVTLAFKARQSAPREIKPSPMPAPQPAPQATDPETAPASCKEMPTRQDLLLGWAGCFVAVYAGGSIGTQFPKLGTELQFTPSTISDILFMLRLARLIYFAGSAWAERLLARPMTGPMLTLAGIAGMMLLSAASHPVLLGLGMGLFGGFMGLRMHYAVAVCMNTPRNTGKLVGINEIVVMVGLLAGSFFGGVLAQHAGLRWPYLASAILFALYAAAETGIRSRSALKRNAP
ncbi:MAG TPA: MFS transporter [Candidatus Brocadiia bacterium]|nr:MFS transporter [Candidatus Brocadiia bacterium]